MWCVAMIFAHASWFPPPRRSFLQQHERRFPSALVLGNVGQFFITAEHNNARPLFVAGKVIELDAHKRVRTHPLNLLSKRADCVEIVFVVGEINRHDVWLVVAGTSQPADRRALQRAPALSFGHGVNKHAMPPLPICVAYCHQGQTAFLPCLIELRAF